MLLMSKWKVYKICITEKLIKCYIASSYIKVLKITWWRIDKDILGQFTAPKILLQKCIYYLLKNFIQLQKSQRSVYESTYQWKVKKNVLKGYGSILAKKSVTDNRTEARMFKIADSNDVKWWNLNLNLNLSSFQS